MLEVQWVQFLALVAGPTSPLRHLPAAERALYYRRAPEGDRSAASKLRSAQRFILLALKDAERIDARTVIDAAMREKIASPATLVRARQALGLRAVETRFGTRSGWVWVRPPH